MGAIGRWPGRRSGGRSREDGIVNIFDRPVILSRRSPRATWGDLNARAPLTFLLLIIAGGGRPTVDDDGGEPMLASPSPILAWWSFLPQYSRFVSKVVGKTWTSSYLPASHIGEIFFFDKGRFITQRVLSITPNICIIKMHTTVPKSRIHQYTIKKVKVNYYVTPMA
jgi:hypothetical protein